MKIAIDQTWITAAFLTACRIGPLFILTPVFGSSQTPVRVRVLLGLALAALLVMGGKSWRLTEVGSFGDVLGAAIVELGIGLAFAFGVMAVFAAFLFGGRLLDLQVGFGVANLLDPITRAQGPLLGTALNLLAVVVFFAFDGHHMILRGLAYSLEQFPPGSALARLNVEAVVAHFGLIFTYGLVLVAPAVFALLLLDVAFALVSRTMPQMNVFVVSMPLKVLIGLFMLGVSMSHLQPAMRRLFESLPPYWHRVLAG